MPKPRPHKPRRQSHATFGTLGPSLADDEERRRLLRDELKAALDAYSDESRKARIRRGEE